MCRLSRVRALQRWVERYGGNVSRKIQPFYLSDSRSSSVCGWEVGLRATETIRPFEVIASVPESLCLIGPSAYSLKRRLIDERRSGSSSSHALYIDALPPLSSVNLFPLSWSEDSTMWKGLERTTLRYIYENRVNIQRVLAPEPPNDDCDSESLVWADCMVTSRALSLGGHQAFVPFIDLANHDDAIGAGQVGDRGCIVLRRPVEASISGQPSYDLIALAEIRPGEEIFHCYGDISFEGKIVEFGWVDSDTPLWQYPTLQVTLPVLPAPRSYGRIKYMDMLCEFDGRRGRLGPSISKFLKEEHFNKRVFINALRNRLKVMKEDLQSIRGSHTTPTSSKALLIVDKPVDVSMKATIIDFEIRKLEYLLKFMVERFDQYRQEEPAILRELKYQSNIEEQCLFVFSDLMKQETGINLLDEVEVDEVAKNGDKGSRFDFDDNRKTTK